MKLLELILAMVTLAVLATAGPSGTIAPSTALDIPDGFTMISVASVIPVAMLETLHVRLPLNSSHVLENVTDQTFKLDRSKCERICNSMGPHGQCIGPKRCVQDGIIYDIDDAPDDLARRSAWTPKFEYDPLPSKSECTPVCNSLGPHGQCRGPKKCEYNGELFNIDDLYNDDSAKLLRRVANPQAPHFKYDPLPNKEPVCNSMGPHGQCVGPKKCEYEGELYLVSELDDLGSSAKLAVRDAFPPNPKPTGCKGKRINATFCEFDNIIYDPYVIIDGTEDQDLTTWPPHKVLEAQRAQCTPYCVKMREDGVCEEITGCGFKGAAMNDDGGINNGAGGGVDGDIVVKVAAGFLASVLFGVAVYL